MTGYVSHYPTCSYDWNKVCTCGVEQIFIIKKLDIPDVNIKVEPDKTPYYRRFESRKRRPT